MPSAASALVCVALALGLAACSSPPPAAPVAAPSVTPLEQYMADATKAKEEGAKNKERDIYRAAARDYPTRKEPWNKLADSYFEAGDYGNAILAAQEVIQRDANDNVATSMLAVSGLRVSTTALSSLRQQNNLRADTRTQAEAVVRTLRDVLGEQALIPPKADATPAPSVDTARRRRTAAAAAAGPKPAASVAAAEVAPVRNAVKPVAVTTPAAPAVTSAVPAPVAPATAPAKKADDNPFKQFK